MARFHATDSPFTVVKPRAQNPLVLGYICRLLRERQRCEPLDPKITLTGFEPEDRWQAAQIRMQALLYRALPLAEIGVIGDIIKATCAHQLGLDDPRFAAKIRESLTNAHIGGADYVANGGNIIYGHCVNCGKEIPSQRLFADAVFPFVIRCCKCQHEYDLNGPRAGRSSRP